MIILALLAFAALSALGAEPPVETVLNTFLTTAPSKTSVVIWSTASGQIAKAKPDGKPTLGFSGLANPGYKVFLDENEVPTHVNGTFFLKVPIGKESVTHKIRFVHPTRGETAYTFDVSFFTNGTSQDHLELSWNKSEWKFLPSGWYDRFRLNGIMVKLGSSGSSFSTQLGWAPTLLGITKTFQIRGNISAAILTYTKGKNFLLLDSGILFALSFDKWTYELGPSLQAWYGYRAHQLAINANVFYGFEKPVLYFIDKAFFGYTYYLAKGIKTHEFKLGIEIVF